MINDEKTINFSQCPLTMQLVLSINPYIISTLQNLIGEDLIIGTVNGEYKGILEDVKTDCIIFKK